MNKILYAWYCGRPHFFARLRARADRVEVRRRAEQMDRAYEDHKRRLVSAASETDTA